jgi:ABC-2 type transport system ATP-binding protein
MILEIQDLTKRLGGHPVLQRLCLSCDPGHITIIYGENGAGKSTLLALIANILAPDRGLIELRPRHGTGPGRLGYVPEAANPPGHMTGDELFALIARLQRAAPIDPATRQALAVDHIARRRIERLSLGERRRVCLAAALIGDPDLLVLDEPTNGLDIDAIATLVTLLQAQRARGTAVLIATHDRDFAERVADRTLRLQDGRLMTETDPA